MLSTAFVLLSSLAASAFAYSTGCKSTLPGTYKLYAVNTTLPNSNSTGVSLIAADVQSDHDGRRQEWTCPALRTRLPLNARQTRSGDG